VILSKLAFSSTKSYSYPAKSLYLSAKNSSFSSMEALVTASYSVFSVISKAMELFSAVLADMSAS